jgi:hypothetical protein
MPARCYTAILLDWRLIISSFRLASVLTSVGDVGKPTKEEVCARFTAADAAKRSNMIVSLWFLVLNQALRRRPHAQDFGE